MRIGDHLVLDVRDHGPGLDAELRAALVIQAQTGSETAPRSGLGLYTVASHVHALGGAIEVGTRAPGGTTIRVRVPSSDAQKERAAGDESRPVGAARLVVARVVKR
jgi:sensor histidine kinase regulating citrate/malate metabolism